jgi:hypothetical protein
MVSSRADIATRFSSEYRDDELLAVVREVADAANHGEPRHVSQRSWDAHRADGGHPGAPSARQITTRLNRAGRLVLSWARIIELSFAGAGQQRQALASADRRPEQHHLDRRHLEAALRRAAREAGTATLHPAQYEQTRTGIIERSAPAAREMVEALLPTVGQIERIARHEAAAVSADGDGSAWDVALEVSGLDPRTPDAAPEIGRKHATEVVEMIGVFAALTGALPTRTQLREFAAEHGLALRDPERRRPWQSYLDEYAAHAAALGQPAAAGPFRGRRYEIADPAGLLDRLPRRYSRGHWAAHPEDALEKLEQYLDALPAGGKPSTRHYRAVKNRDGRADWPGLNVFTEHYGGFGAAVAIIRRRRGSG